MPLSIEDKLAIQELVARYNHAVDSGDGAAYAATFTEDGVMQAGEMRMEGRDTLEQFAKGFAQSQHAPRHIASNLLIEGDGDRATLKAYIQMFAMAGDPPTQQIATAGLYSDELVKKDGQWLFVRREFIADS